ncbi:Tryptophan synthase beta subunit-like PLP-dependent enzymes superfamily [Penicillium verhagenii]|uniref:Tryptophan synthase beta subunit-like PLP-dependent enzymes superfamily n=1 Tax=Penicillium verhagenii TaxID=1562060 RepID=UPI00254589DE|nr:Tryptophan synthase beta subunit-like PLP-dependent enzymes superfamily [Penicillium verhagenii]KAJ5947586.1 Tryptophan synthase beta subunit-like PLP-dependent enzymes superfamily [Penicillium verhagenii]
MPLQLPERFAQIPRYPLLYSHPSPIHPQSLYHTFPPRLIPYNPQVSIFVKREDQSSPMPCPGNKYRKLEYIVPDLLSENPKYGYHEDHPPKEQDQRPARRPRLLVTEGAVQSNHAVQVGALAAKLELSKLLLLRRGTGGGYRTAENKTSFMSSGNMLMNTILGNSAVFCENMGSDLEDMGKFLEGLGKTAGGEPYWISSGASLHPLGGLGYARAAFEIAEQEKEIKLGGSGRFDFVFVACGSGSTVGGLIAGFKLLEKMDSSSSFSAIPAAEAGSPSETKLAPRMVVGILTSPTMPRSYHEERVLKFARQAGELIGLEAEQDISMADVRLDDEFVGEEYGVMDANTQKTLFRFAEAGLLLDPVYTAKAARGMMSWVEENKVKDYAKKYGLEEVNVLFIHTGGQAALGAYADKLSYQMYED